MQGVTHAHDLRSRLAHAISAVLCMGVPFVLANVLVKLLPAGEEWAPLRNGVKILILVAAYVVYVRWLGRRSPTELGLQGALRETGLGFLIGATLISISVALLASLGLYQVDGVGIDSMWPRYVLGCFAVAILEELIFRVFLFQLIEESLGSSIAIVLSTALFALVHLANPYATWFSTASLAITSLVLVGALLLTRRLWFCLGIHWSWNLAQAFYSLPVSGNETKGFVSGHLVGPQWLTGGDFGIEASVLTLLLSAIVAGALLYSSSTRARFRPPYWIVDRTSAKR